MPGVGVPGVGVPGVGVPGVGVPGVGPMTALARKLAVILLRIWLSGDEFRWSRGQSS